VVFHFLAHSTKNIRSDRCSNFPDSLFQVFNVVNTNTVDGLLHIPPETKIQGCQVWRAWGSMLPPAPPNPVPWKCLIKKFRNNVGLVRRTVLLKYHIVIINLGYCANRSPTCLGNCVMSECVPRRNMGQSRDLW
jgi:hypothetical protein